MISQIWQTLRPTQTNHIFNVTMENSFNHSIYIWVSSFKNRFSYIKFQWAYLIKHTAYFHNRFTHLWYQISLSRDFFDKFNPSLTHQGFIYSLKTFNQAGPRDALQNLDPTRTKKRQFEYLFSVELGLIDLNRCATEHWHGLICKYYNIFFDGRISELIWRT